MTRTRGPRIRNPSGGICSSHLNSYHPEKSGEAKSSNHAGLCEMSLGWTLCGHFASAARQSFPTARSVVRFWAQPRGIRRRTFWFLAVVSLSFSRQSIRLFVNVETKVETITEGSTQADTRIFSPCLPQGPCASIGHHLKEFKPLRSLHFDLSFFSGR